MLTFEQRQMVIRKALEVDETPLSPREESIIERACPKKGDLQAGIFAVASSERPRRWNCLTLGTGGVIRCPERRIGRHSSRLRRF